MTKKARWMLAALVALAVGTFIAHWSFRYGSLYRCLAMDSPMPAKDYWYYSVVVGNVWTERETEQYLCVVQQLEEWQEHHRVDKASLKDLSVKETVFREEVAGFTEFMSRNLESDRELMKSLERQMGGPVEHPQRFNMKSLERMTGERFEEPEEWIGWYERNHDRLRISPDGQRLTAR